MIFVYRDNIKALWRGLTTDTGEIGEMIQETQKQTKNALSDAGMNVSEDDFNKLNNGDLSQEEIEAIIYDSLTDASNGTPTRTPVRKRLRMTKKAITPILPTVKRLTRPTLRPKIPQAEPARILLKPPADRRGKRPAKRQARK